MSMRVYTCTKFTGHNPVGVAAIMKGNSAVHAAERLNAELRKRGLPGDAKPEDCLPLPGNGQRICLILCDGNY